MKQFTARIIAGAAGLTLVAALAVPASAGHVSDTSVKIRETAPVFHGKVESDNRFCVGNRKVKLYYKRRPGAPKHKLGGDRANENGRWRVSNGFILKSGLYFAKAERIVFEEGARMVCRGDTSRKIFVD
ncbi:hypothetical protein BH24ACT23_BH24ACT23_08230 [soil metagenome]